MIVYKPAFKLFIKALLLKIRDKEFSDMPTVQLRRPSRHLWDQKGPKDLVPRSLVIAGDYSDNVFIFEDIYHRGLEYHSQGISIVISGLKYLQIELPDSFDNIVLDDEQKAGLMFQIFLEKQGQNGIDLLKSCPELEVYNWQQKQFYSSTDVGIPSITGASASKNSERFRSTTDVKEAKIASAHDFIRKYYGFILQSQFKLALDCWMPFAAKNRWHDSYYEFGREAFENLSYSIYFCDISKNKHDKLTCIVLLEETVFICSTPEELRVEAWPPAVNSYNFDELVMEKADKMEDFVSKDRRYSYPDDYLHERNLMRQMMLYITEPEKREMIKQEIPNRFKRDVNRLVITNLDFSTGTWKIESSGDMHVNQYRKHREGNWVMILRDAH